MTAAQCRAKTGAGLRCKVPAQLQGLCTRHVRQAWVAAYELYDHPTVTEVVDTIHLVAVGSWGLISFVGLLIAAAIAMMLRSCWLQTL